jgi:hypothetical protein
MRRTSQWVLWLSFGLMLVVPFAPAQTTHRHRARKSLVKPVALPPLPAGPLPQVPMDQMPAAAPQVTYEQGALRIVAENSTLGDILREVRKRTGASIDVPQNANERVVTRLGPGPARDVLASLLNGTSFNYVMAGSPADPAVLSTVVLTPKAAGGESPPQTVAVYQPPQPQYPGLQQGFVPPPGQVGLVPQNQPPAVATADDSADDSSDDSADDSADDQSDAQPDANAGAAQAPQPNAGPKSPEQILEMLRRNQQPGQQGQPGNPPDNQQQ